MINGIEGEGQKGEGRSEWRGKLSMVCLPAAAALVAVANPSQ